MNKAQSKTLKESIKQLQFLKLNPSTRTDVNNFTMTLDYDFSHVPNSISDLVTFTGNLGTGKYTVAKLLSKIFFHGKLKVMYPNSFINPKSPLFDHREAKKYTKKIIKDIKEAKGGVLYIPSSSLLIPTMNKVTKTHWFSTSTSVTCSPNSIFDDEKAVALKNLLRFAKGTQTLVILSMNLSGFIKLEENCPYFKLCNIYFKNIPKEQIRDIIINKLLSAHYKFNVIKAEHLMDNALNNYLSDNLLKTNGRLAYNIFEFISDKHAQRLYTYHLNDSDKALKNEYESLSEDDIKNGLKATENEYRKFINE